MPESGSFSPINPQGILGIRPDEGMTKLVETLRAGKRGYAGAVAFGLVWFLAVRVAWSEWELNPQYQYGLALPVLCAVFFVLRWRDRPAGEIVAGRPAAAAWLVMGISTLVICAVQPVSEANPGWRLLSGLALSAAVAWTLGAAFLAGGLPWLRHFAFPSALLLTGIPWPRELEEGIMSVLIQANSQIVVEALNWCGHAAEQQGNLILLPGGLLGVEEACSGIRSLQSGIVAALCYGELLRLGAGRRWVLVGVALVVTLAGNTLRMTLLSFVATTMGFSAEKSWHDPAGVVLLVGSIIAIGVAGSFMGRKKNSRSVTESGRPSRLPASGEDSRRDACSTPLLWASSVALIISWAGTEAWYRSHERAGERPVEWSLARQSVSGKARDLRVPDRTLDILRFPEGFSESWMDESGLRWQAYYFRWMPGKVGAQVTYTHTPTVCLAATGMVLEQTYPPVLYEKGGLRMSIDAYRFRDKGQPLFVFHAISEDFSKAIDEAPSGGASVRGRFDAVRDGRRNRGQRLLELAAWNAGSYEEAERGLRAVLDENIRLAGPSGQ